MIKLIRNSLVLGCAFLPLSVLAEQNKYEVLHPSVNYQPFYPGLDLNQLESMELSTESSEHSPEDKLTQLKLEFRNATDLVAKNFSYDGANYRAIVNGAWVYKQVLVEVSGPEIHADGPVNVRLYVVEQQSNLNNPGHSFGAELLSAEGHAEDITPNALADATTIKMQGKNLNLRLYKRIERDRMSGQQGFKVETRWLGHGDRAFYVAAPFPAPEAERFTAIGLDIQSEILPEGETEFLFQIRYEDEFGGQTTTPLEPLRPYLDQAYGAAYPSP
ncbi:hypothetical protein [Agaribacterium haliotis]|uniref:hypothetical protein n=1 Tax=Agaribacterium haliotis TaxID=2013869 RepID=UPI000BB54D5B|nr:hypothetical protein [Agaribacterium haliotis]